MQLIWFFFIDYQFSSLVEKNRFSIIWQTSLSCAPLTFLSSISLHMRMVVDFVFSSFRRKINTTRFNITQLQKVQLEKLYHYQHPSKPFHTVANTSCIPQVAKPAKPSQYQTSTMLNFYSYWDSILNPHILAILIANCGRKSTKKTLSFVTDAPFFALSLTSAKLCSPPSGWEPAQYEKKPNSFKTRGIQSLRMLSTETFTF